MNLMLNYLIDWMLIVKIRGGKRARPSRLDQVHKNPKKYSVTDIVKGADLKP